MKKSQRKQVYLGMFIVFLMVSSTIGFIYNSGDNENYGGQDFVQTENGWATYVESVNQYVVFNYLPEELNFDVDVGSLTSKIYVVLNDDSAYSDMVRKFAFLGVVTERIELDEVDCNGQNSVLIFQYSEYNKIYKDNNCVYLEGYTPQLSDRLFYRLFGVI